MNLDEVGKQGDPAHDSWTSKDCILYALAVGAGAQDPTGAELEFTTENSEGRSQKVLPTFAVIAAFSSFAGGPAFQRLGVDKAMTLHGEQEMIWHAPLPAEGRITTVPTITAVYDKGAGALVASEVVSTDADTGDVLVTQRTAIFVREAGGWGGERGPSLRFDPPARGPDHEVTYPTRIDQALLYRLCGDRNPLHSDPAVAARVGFERPILHGLCTYGFTGRALLHTFCGSEPERLRSMRGRFSKPVLPGDALTINMWETGEGEALYQTRNQHGDVVIDAGRCTFA